MATQELAVPSVRLPAGINVVSICSKMKGSLMGCALLVTMLFSQANL